MKDEEMKVFADKTLDGLESILRIYSEQMMTDMYYKLKEFMDRVKQ